MKQKKLLAGLLALVATFFLVACSGGLGKVGTKTADFQMLTEGQSDIRNHIEYQGDKVVVLKTTTTLFYNVFGVDTKEAAETFMKAQGVEKWDGIKGITHKVTYEKDRLIEETSVDMNKVDMEKLNKVMPLQTQDGKKAKYISYKLTKENFDKLGYKEIKDGKFEELKAPKKVEKVKK